MTPPAWLADFLFIGAVVGTTVTLGRYLVRPFLRIIRIGERIAEEFQPNGGDSFRDSIDRQNVLLTEQNRLLGEHIVASAEQCAAVRAEVGALRQLVLKTMPVKPAPRRRTA